MKRLRDRIQYRSEETERGSRVVLRTNDADALAAIHEFLRFQILTGLVCDARARPR